jgi:hypothetical protein
MKRNFVVLGGAGRSGLASTGCDKLKARDNLKRGVSHHERQISGGRPLQKAVELDPSFPTTHTYLAIAYMS